MKKFDPWGNFIGCAYAAGAFAALVWTVMLLYALLHFIRKFW